MAPRPVWMGGKSRPQRDSISDRPTRSQSLYRLSYMAHRYDKSSKYLRKNLALNDIIWDYISVSQTGFRKGVSGFPRDENA